MSWKGAVEPYVGRLERAHAQKRDVRVIDYVDQGEPMLVRMFEKRMRTYRRLGYDTTGPLDLGGAPPREPTGAHE